MLERAGLIVRGREAQWRPAKLQAAPLKEASDWVEQYRQNWEESFDRLGAYLKYMQAVPEEGIRKEDDENKSEINRIRIQLYDLFITLMFFSTNTLEYALFPTGNFFTNRLDYKHQT